MKKLLCGKPLLACHSAVSYTGEDFSELMENSASGSTWCLVTHVSNPRALITGEMEDCPTFIFKVL